jgi:hypothetical protein
VLFTILALLCFTDPQRRLVAKINWFLEARSAVYKGAFMSYPKSIWTPFTIEAQRHK